MFLLRKWYLDCVTERGDAFIGYSARLRWEAVRVCYTSALLAPARGEPVERYSFLPVGAPAPAPRGLRWRCRRLCLAGAWHPVAPPIERDLLTDDAGGAAITWSCLAPAATARVRVRGAVLPGLGYAERLTLALEPWRLPFTTLYWGRFLAPGASLVWIVWEDDDAAAATLSASAALVATPARANDSDDPAARPGAPATQGEPQGTGGAGPASGGPGASAPRFVFRDARPGELTAFVPGRLAVNDGSVLELEGARVLRRGPVFSAPLRALPRLAARVPAAFLAAREEKWLSRGTLRSPLAPPVSGWAIHERVSFR